MKLFVKLMICMILVTGVLVGCAPQAEDKAEEKREGTYSDDLFYADIEDINLIQVDHKMVNRKQFEDKEVIKEVVEKLSDIKLKELTNEAGLELIKGSEIIYNISLFSNGDLIGSALIFENGQMVFTDTKSGLVEGKAISYVNEEPANEKHAAIVSYLEGLEGLE